MYREEKSAMITVFIGMRHEQVQNIVKYRKISLIYLTLCILVGTDRFIFKNKRTKPDTQSSRLMNENLQLKNECLKLQKRNQQTYN